MAFEVLCFFPLLQVSYFEKKVVKRSVGLSYSVVAKYPSHICKHNILLCIIYPSFSHQSRTSHGLYALPLLVQRYQYFIQ